MPQLHLPKAEAVQSMCRAFSQQLQMAVALSSPGALHLLVVGIEVSLWVAERFGGDLQVWLTFAASVLAAAAAAHLQACSALCTSRPYAGLALEGRLCCQLCCHAVSCLASQQQA